MDINYNNDVIEVDIIEVFWLLLKKAWLIFLIALIFAVGTFAGMKMLQKPVYQSTGSILIMNHVQNEASQSEISFNSKILSDCKEILTSRTVVTQMINNMGLSSSYEQMAGNIDVSEVEDTRILEITVSSSTPQQAKALVDELQKIAVIHIEDIFEVCTVKVIDEGNISMGPIANNLKLYVIVAFGIGAIIAVAGIVAQYLLDGTLKTAEHIEKYLHCVTLGCVSSKEPEVESFKVLRTNIKATKEDLSTILITNCGNADVVCKIGSELKKAFEECGKKAVYITADMHGTNKETESAILGKVTDELKVAEELEKLKNENDIVLISVPALHKYIDAAVVASKCDGTIVVVEKGKVHYRTLQEAIKQLIYVKANVMGCIIDKG